MICSQKSEIKEDQQISGMERYEENEIMIVSNDTNKIPEDKNDVERDVRKCAKKNMIKKRH